MSIEGMTEWRDEDVALIRLDGVEQHARFPRGLYGQSVFQRIPGREVRYLIGHHSAGPKREGPAAVDGIASFAVAPPTYGTDGELVGGGKGWPGEPYQIVIPGAPTIRDGRVAAYRVWDDDWWTWHTGPTWNRHGIGVCVTGWYRSRHDLLAPQAQPAPDPLVMLAAERVFKYLLAKHRLKPGEALLSHADCGKPACPGDALENMIRRMRGDDELVLPGDGPLDLRPLRTVKEVQAALVELKLDPGKLDGIMGPRTQNALKLFQKRARIRVDGIFGPITERAMRLALAAQPRSV